MLCDPDSMHPTNIPVNKSNTRQANKRGKRKRKGIKGNKTSNK
jgi:hypothetical protein